MCAKQRRSLASVIVVRSFEEYSDTRNSEDELFMILVANTETVVIRAPKWHFRCVHVTLHGVSDELVQN